MPRRSPPGRSSFPFSSACDPSTAGSPPAESRMSAAPASVKFPTLFRTPGDTRITSPGVGVPKQKRLTPAPGQQALWSTEMDPDVLAYAEATREALAPTCVPEEQRKFLRRNTGLRRMYDDWILPDLQRRVSAGTLSKGTLEKDQQALARWERFTRPDTWAEAKEWPGWPLEFITERVLEEFLTRLFANCPAATARSTWSHLRNILNQAVRVRALDTCPKPAHIPDADDGPVQIYRDEQLAAAYHCLRHEIDLQVAFVLGVNAGPRTVDLFLLRWADFDLSATKPWFSFVARKTRKRQTIPLAPLTVAHLRRLPSLGRSEFLFPGRSSPLSKDPEKATRSRHRRELMRERYLAAGLEAYDKPIQAARATCNTRLERHRTGSGQFVVGHALTLNSRHYHEPSDLVFDAVTSIEQPACFHQF